MEGVVSQPCASGPGTAHESCGRSSEVLAPPPLETTGRARDRAVVSPCRATGAGLLDRCPDEEGHVSAADVAEARARRASAGVFIALVFVVALASVTNSPRSVGPT